MSHFWQRAKEGELMIDHRASPGLTEDQARLFGYDPTAVKEGKLFEAATMTCGHCGTIVIRNPGRTRERGFCPKCSHYICDQCVSETRQPDYVHQSRQQKIELIANAGAKSHG